MPRKIWTAAELEKMTREQQQAIFDASIVTNLDEVPADFVAEVRASTEAHIARHEAHHSD